MSNRVVLCRTNDGLILGVGLFRYRFVRVRVMPADSACGLGPWSPFPPAPGITSQNRAALGGSAVHKAGRFQMKLTFGHIEIYLKCESCSLMCGYCSRTRHRLACVVRFFTVLLNVAQPSSPTTASPYTENRNSTVCAKLRKYNEDWGGGSPPCELPRAHACTPSVPPWPCSGRAALQLRDRASALGHNGAKYPYTIHKEQPTAEADMQRLRAVVSSSQSIVVSVALPAATPLSLTSRSGAPRSSSRSTCHSHQPVHGCVACNWHP